MKEIIALLKSNLNSLNLFAKVNGLAEILKDGTPAVYQSNGNLVQITDADYNSGVCFFTQLQGQDIDDTITQPNACDRFAKVTIPISFIGIINRGSGGEDSGYYAGDLALTCLKALIINNPLALRQELKLTGIRTNLKTINTLSNEILTAFKLKESYKLAAVRIELDLTIEGTITCINQLLCLVPA